MRESLLDCWVIGCGFFELDNSRIDDAAPKSSTRWEWSREKYGIQRPTIPRLQPSVASLLLSPSIRPDEVEAQATSRQFSLASVGS